MNRNLGRLVGRIQNRTLAYKGRLFKRNMNLLPPRIQVSASDRCNFSCGSCWIHAPNVIRNETNHEANLFSTIKPSIMDMPLYRSLITEIASKQHLTIDFVGKGEATLNPNLVDMIALASENGMSPCLTTNGSGLSFELLKDLQGLNVSLNACNVNSHKSFSHVKKDYFTETVEFIRRMRDSGKNFTNLTLSFIIGAYNISQIPHMIKLSRELLLPGNRVTLFPEWIFPGNEQNRISKEQFESLLVQLPVLKSDLEESKISHNLDLFPYVLYAIMLSDEWNLPTRDYYSKNPCRVVNNYLVILADGRVVPCCRSGYVLGDISEQGIYDVWGSERARNFRYQATIIHKLKRELPQSHCFSCDHLMGSMYFREKYNDCVEAFDLK